VKYVVNELTFDGDRAYSREEKTGLSEGKQKRASRETMTEKTPQTREEGSKVSFVTRRETGGKKYPFG